MAATRPLIDPERLERVAGLIGSVGMPDPRACEVLAEASLTLHERLPESERPILLPLLPRLLGSRGSAALAARRAAVAADWLLRSHAPAWLRQAGLSEAADRLTALPEITDLTQLSAARPAILKARRAAAIASEHVGIGEKAQRRASEVLAGAPAVAAREAVRLGWSVCSTRYSGSGPLDPWMSDLGDAVVFAGLAADGADLPALRRDLLVSAVAMLARMIALTDGDVPAPEAGFALANLPPRGCRYPITADRVPPGRHRFCGAPVRPGSSYCPEHWRIAHSTRGDAGISYAKAAELQARRPAAAAE
ncbi:GcrA family cell cycle regulator [Methylobacterium sp. JK268]